MAAPHHSPASVADLATAPGWTVTTAGPRGHWQTAERTIRHGGRTWTLGLTPARGADVALILWCDDTVAAHHRGSEADLVRTACRWAAGLIAGRPATTSP